MVHLNPIRARRISPNIVEEWSADGRLIIFSVGDGERPTVDTWAEAVRTVIRDWPSDQVCLLLHDLHKCGYLAFDAHMQRKLLELHDFELSVNRHTALVMPGEFTADLVRLFVKVQELSAARRYPIQWEIFLTRSKALTWLQQVADISPGALPLVAVRRRS